jgi:hypothetical protein
MKSTFLKTAMVVLVVTFVSCSSDSSDSNSANANQTTFKLDGVLITADETTATDYTSVLTGERQIDDYAYKDGIEVLELHMPANVGDYPAEQTIGSTTNSWLTYEANDGMTFPDDYFHSTSGMMSLTTVDLSGNKLRGNFNFVGDNTITTKNITEGVLAVNEMTHQ